MAKREPIIVAGETFQTKKAVEDRCREILYAYPIGARVAEHHAVFLYDLLKRHTEAETKIGFGVDHFTVQRAEQGSQCFNVTRIDGTRIDFSFKACLTPKTPEHDLRAACRTAVVGEKMAFRDRCFAAGPVFCDVSGEPLTLDNTHVDHAPPYEFEALVAGFLAWRGAMPPIDPGGGTVTRFLYQSDAESFVTYHNTYAKLRLVSRRVNLSDLRKGK
jgi:hypothetical protein